MTADYELLAHAPSVDDYCALRAAAGLSTKTPEAARIGLAGTWFGVTIVHAGSTVGMGRVVGDGGCFFQVVDIAVLPVHQGRGVGKRIVAALIGHLREHAPPSAYVSLLADGQAQGLYRQYGFAPSAPSSVGMFLRL